MGNLLPFIVKAFGSVIASFNNEHDAKVWARVQSSKSTNGWKEVVYSFGNTSTLIVAYQNDRIVYGE